METETIRAAHNLTIELSPTRWRLLNGSGDPAVSDEPTAPGAPVELVQARADAIHCAPDFARLRHLPGDGQLVPADIARVVVGWAPESGNWHLGLLLAARPETNFRMQWCGLASWPRGHASEHATPARLAGQSLARVIDRPFHLIPPPQQAPPGPLTETQPMQTTAPMEPVAAAAPAEQPDRSPDAPPFRFDEWALVATRHGLAWRRRSRWLIERVLRAVGLVLLAGLFVVMGLGAQTGGLAAVEPAWLPWLGIAVAIVLVGQAAYNGWQLITAADVLVDRERREVRCRGRFMGDVRWRVPFAAVAYVLVSQSPARLSGRPEADEPARIAQDAWLHIYDGNQFREVAALGRVEGQSDNWGAVRRSHQRKGRRRLWLRHLDTPAHHAARVMAEALETEVWLDVR